MSRENDDGFMGFLESLTRNGHLEGAADGITKQVIARGVESLSEKQKYVFDNEVLANFVGGDCERCGSDIPWSEKYAALDNGGLCDWCAHMVAKQDD